jgi:hypothetical protein
VEPGSEGTCIPTRIVAQHPSPLNDARRPAIHYLIKRWDMVQVDELLKEFEARTSVATAIQNKLFVSHEQFITSGSKASNKSILE